MAKSGCPDKCGNVTVPYPFGIGSSCYYSEWYSITCNNSTAVLAKFDLEVLGITLGSKQVKVNSPMVINCTAANTTWTSTNLGGSPYSYSPVDNVFVPVLCPATSLSNGQDTIVAQCGRNCDSNSRRYSNLGEEICETYPPFSLSVYDVNIAHSNGTCSYVFMVDADYVDMSYVSQSQRSVLQVVRNGTYIPVRLDWVYEYLPGLGFDPKCSQSEEGYSCHCPSDEGGNPYLPNGCQSKISKLSPLPFFLNRKFCFAFFSVESVGPNENGPSAIECWG